MTSVARLRDAGYRIVGDLDDLTALEPDPEAVPPEDVTDAELLDAAYDLIADLLAQLRAATTATRPYRARSDPSSFPPTRHPPAVWTESASVRRQPFFLHVGCRKSGTSALPALAQGVALGAARRGSASH